MSSDSGPSSRVDPGNLWFACRLMLDFAYDAGLEVPPELTADIIALDILLVQIGAEPISRINPALCAEPAPPLAPSVEPTAAAAPAAPPRSAAALMHDVHAALSRLIKPATAFTVMLSEPPSEGRFRFVDVVPLLVKVASVVAIVSATLFVVSAAFMSQATQDAKAVVAAASAASAAGTQAAKGTP